MVIYIIILIYCSLFLFGRLPVPVTDLLVIRPLLSSSFDFQVLRYCTGMRWGLFWLHFGFRFEILFFFRERWEPQAPGSHAESPASAVPQDLVARNNRDTPPAGVQTITVQAAPPAQRPSGRRNRGGDNVKFQCNSCSRSFSQPNALLKHAEIHTKEGSFMCSLCNKF